ncbi:hypothetical protein [Heyndrickxia sporothermodurans]|uniref:hypothetical protein n=1 Tax=Heyndrickxia sporothermodurans TaxID=46224 RepID=UPI000D36982D|nr:hypothetical protein [Heyndrickxia sporothermodurans]PTY92926.1 hypothetical protein B5V90_02275 [Heyndrickxia sporothermodurans]
MANQIIGRRCEVTDMFLVNVRKRRMTKKGTIRGFYLNEYWHPYTYRAFHIEFDDGTKDTYRAKDVNLL